MGGMTYTAILSLTRMQPTKQEEKKEGGCVCKHAGCEETVTSSQIEKSCTFQENCGICHSEMALSRSMNAISRQGKAWQVNLYNNIHT